MRTAAPFEQLARTVEEWQRQDVRAVLARVAEYQGFGGGRRGELLAINVRGEQAGELLRGTATAAVLAAATPLLSRGHGASTVDVRVPGDEAVVAGLSCGGRATIIAASVSGVPDLLWSALRTRISVAVACPSASPETVLVVSQAGATAGSLGEPELDAQVVDRARELLATGVAATETLAGGVLLQTYHPTRRLLVVGEGEVADAILSQADLLEWGSTWAADLETARRQLVELGPSDGVVVLSHSAAVDAPVLAAALRGSVGYVGALGSRGTQARRSGQLRDLGLGDDEIARIYGPVGLDIRSSSPAETAVAICAEILAVAAGRPPSRCVTPRGRFTPEQRPSRFETAVQHRGGPEGRAGELRLRAALAGIGVRSLRVPTTRETVYRSTSRRPRSPRRSSGPQRSSRRCTDSTGGQTSEKFPSDVSSRPVSRSGTDLDEGSLARGKTSVAGATTLSG